MRAHEREQTVLPLATLLAGLGEARRDHAQCVHAVAERVRCRVEHMLGGQTDDRELDRVVDLPDRRVGAHAGDRLPFEVDGERGADEICFEDVAEELAPDRATPARRTDHGNCAGAKNGRNEATTAV